MSVFLTVAVIVISALCGEWRMSVRFYADLLANEARAEIYVFGLSVKRVRLAFGGFSFVAGCLWIEVNGERKGIAVGKGGDGITKYMKNPFARSVDVKYLRTDALIGADGFDFETAVVVYAARLAADVAVGLLRGMQQAAFERHIMPVFGKNSAKISIFGIICAVPANIISGFAAAAIKKARVGQTARRAKSDIRR